MKSISHLTIFFWLLLTCTTTIYAVEPLPKNLIKFASRPTADLFKGNLNVNSLKLLSHYTTQKTVTYCGIASTVMVLNSTDISSPIDSQHLSYHYFNQDDFFNNKVKKIITPEEVLKEGICLKKLSKVIRTFGLNAKPYYADELNLEEFRRILKNAILNQHFIIANFLRTELQQKGGGHYSPIAAYDRKTDRFLILDVSRYKYPAYWVKTKDLWKAIHTKDANTYRGFIIIHP